MPRSIAMVITCGLLACAAEGDPTRGGPCSTEEDCDEGFSCGALGRCIASGVCDTGTDCGASEACIDGMCAPAGCASGATCPDGQMCSTTGRCIASGTCLADGDCTAPMRCSAAGGCIDAGACVVNADCGAGMVCDPAAMMCMVGSDCGAEELVATGIPPNLMIVLDRSCSMRDRVGTLRKWEIAVQALVELTTTYTDQIRWGLILFPDRGDSADCRQLAPIPVPLGDGNEAAIQTLLTNALATSDFWWPDGPCVTNIDTGMEQAAMDPALVSDPAHRGYALLVTDGRQSSDCGGGARDAVTEATIASLFAAGVPTFVVGFGAEVDPMSLDQFAIAGGMPLPASPRYYQADDPTGLSAAFGEVARGIITCDYVLASVPPDLAMTYVFFDDREMVSRDTTRTTGWDYDMATNTVTFYGPDCERLRSGEVMDVDIVFGCPGPVLM